MSVTMTQRSQGIHLSYHNNFFNGINIKFPAFSIPQYVNVFLTFCSLCPVLRDPFLDPVNLIRGAACTLQQFTSGKPLLFPAQAIRYARY